MMASTAAERGCRFIDLFHEFRTDSSQPVTENGLHLNDLGYRRLAAAMEAGLNLPARNWSVHIAVDGTVKEADGVRVANARRDSAGLSFEATDDVLPLPLMDDGEPARSLAITGLSPGGYALFIDSRKVQTAKAEDWAAGQQIRGGPSAAQFEALREAIIEKNQLYFHHWRPQNFTYLFGFRKHEQGQNAPEVDKFLKLVAEKEAEIAKLRVPAPHKYELVREEVQP
jgi:hypothetical protein